MGDTSVRCPWIRGLEVRVPPSALSVSSLLLNQNSSLALAMVATIANWTGLDFRNIDDSNSLSKETFSE